MANIRDIWAKLFLGSDREQPVPSRSLTLREKEDSSKLAQLTAINDVHPSKDGKEAAPYPAPKQKMVEAVNPRAHQEFHGIPQRFTGLIQQLSSKAFSDLANREANAASGSHGDVAGAQSSKDNVVNSQQHPVNRNSGEGLVSAPCPSEEPLTSTVLLAQDRGDRENKSLALSESGTKPSSTGDTAVQPAESTYPATTEEQDILELPVTEVVANPPSLFSTWNEQDIQTLWDDEVMPRLIIDIQAFQRENTKVHKGHVRIPSMSAELEIHEQTAVDGQVTATPSICFLYHGVKSEVARKFVSRLGWLSGEGFESREIRPQCPRPATLRVSVDNLQLSDASSISLPQGDKLYMHVEEPESDSACGLLCCATFIEDGNVRAQHVSRIGGLMNIDARIAAITTSHGFLEQLLLSTVDWDSDSESDSNDGFGNEDEKPTDSCHHEAQIGTINLDVLNNVSWTQLSPEAIQETCFFGLEGQELTEVFLNSIDRSRREDTSLWRKAISPSTSSENSGNSQNGDFSFLQLPHGDGLHNSYIRAMGQGIADTVVLHRLAKPEEIESGLVDLLLRPDKVAQATLLPNPMLFSPYGVAMRAFKLALDGPLAPGCSGTWVAQNGLLCGMIIALYDEQAFAVMIPSYQLAQDIQNAFPYISTVELPRWEGNKSTVKLDDKDEDLTSKSSGHGITLDIGEFRAPVKFKCIIISGPYRKELDLFETESTVSLNVFKFELRSKYHMLGQFSIHRSARSLDTGDLVPGPGISGSEFTLEDNETIFVIGLGLFRSVTTEPLLRVPLQESPHQFDPSGTTIWSTNMGKNNIPKVDHAKATSVWSTNMDRNDIAKADQGRGDCGVRWGGPSVPLQESSRQLDLQGPKAWSNMWRKDMTKADHGKGDRGVRWVFGGSVFSPIPGKAATNWPEAAGAFIPVRKKLLAQDKKAHTLEEVHAVQNKDTID